MMRLLALFVLFAAHCPALVAHPFDDRAEMITEVLIINDGVHKGAETLRLTVQYRYENIYASYNEAYVELDDDHDERVSAKERDARFAELVKDITEAAHLHMRGKPVTLIPNYEEFALADLANPDNTIDAPGGMDIRQLRIGYYFTFDVELPQSWDAGQHRIELFFVSDRIKMTDPTDQLRAFDDRTERRRAVTTVSYDRLKVGGIDKDRMTFLWEIKTFCVGTEKAQPETQPKPPVNDQPPANGPPTNEPASNTAADSPDKRRKGEDILRQTDEDRRDTTSTDSRIEQAIKDLRDGGADPWVWLSVLSLMFVIGGYHAVQPGHGKTLVAGYLIGTQGKQSDALFLGIVVTAAHTSGVFLLMGGAWAASKIWPGALQDPHKQIAELITFAVGATIMLMGFGLALKRAGGGKHGHDAFGRHTDGSHDHPHDHTHTHDSEPDLKAANGHASAASGHVPHDHGHSHDHGHTHDHGHDHTHDHHHGRDPALMTRWEVLRLGILGGVVPCPSAFVIGLVAFSQQLYFAGLVMILVFSLGLAAVLATIGLILVNTKAYLNEKRRSTKSKLYLTLEAKLPVFGALVITVIGVAMVMLAAIRLGWIDPTQFAV